ncbi:MAG: anti-sigma factor [Vicinamibacterales bacterium]
MAIEDCRRVAERITQYVDGNLPPDERGHVDDHLAACPPCRGAAADGQAGRTVLRGCAQRLRSSDSETTLPPGLRTRCEALAREHRLALVHATGWISRFAPVGLAVLFVALTAAAMVAVATQHSDTLLAAQLTADHMKCFRGFPPQGATADAGQVEAMLRARYGWDLHVPPSSGPVGLGLVGARRCLYADGRIPHVMYRAHGQDVSLFILEGVARADADVTSLGHRARIWSRGSNTYVMVSSATGGDLANVASYVRQEAH